MCVCKILVINLQFLSSEIESTSTVLAIENLETPYEN